MAGDWQSTGGTTVDVGRTGDRVVLDIAGLGQTVRVVLTSQQAHALAGVVRGVADAVDCDVNRWREEPRTDVDVVYPVSGGEDWEAVGS